MASTALRTLANRSPDRPLGTVGGSGGGWPSDPTRDAMPSTSPSAASATTPRCGPGACAFRAELDLAEIDTRGRPGTTWTGRASELSRSQLVFRSRRMCYEGREVVIAVHLVDDRPVPLYGMIALCEYDGDGLYRTRINLLPLPESESIRAWVHGVGSQSHRLV